MDSIDGERFESIIGNLHFYGLQKTTKHQVLLA